MTLVSLVLIICFLCFSNIILFTSAQNSVFREVVRQKTRGNQIQQCPCVLHPESRQCISYDSRYVAVSYEEAILSFRDLSNSNYPPSLVNSNTFNCESNECRQCFSLLYNRLNEIGFIPPNYSSSITVLPQNQVNPNLCPRYSFARQQTSPAPPVVVPPYVQNLISAGQQFRATHPLSSSSSRNQQNSGSPPASVPNLRNLGNRNNQNQNGNNNGNNRNQNQNQNQIQNQNRNQNQNGNGNNRNQNQNQNQRQNQFQNQGRNNNNNQRQNFNQNNNFNRNFNRNQNQNQNQFFNRPQQQQQQFQRPNNFQNNFNQFNGQQFQPQQQQQQNWQQAAQSAAQPHWNGQFWEQAVRSPLQSSFNSAFGNGQNSNGNFPQVPVVVQPPPAPAVAQPALPSVIGEWGGHNWGLGSVGGGGGQNGQNGQFNIFSILGGRAKHKRAADDVVGQRFQISCIERGDAEDEMLSLCGSCWTWRQLPENYFPRIINELSCKADDFCLSGWGECIQQFRNVDVLRRESGRWIPTVITTATCCDCRVRAGTEIHSLVIGGKK